MDAFITHFGDWLLFLGLIGLGLYTMRVIRREGSTFREESLPHQFHALNLHVPKWWTQTRADSDVIQFERTDTRYDWWARFTLLKDTRLLTDILAEKVERDELDYDRDDVVIETDPRVLFRRDSMRGCAVVRVEGKASQRIEDRIYLDIFLIRPVGMEGCYLCESRSSVLNGMVEGPYFEECLAEAELSGG
jgi:hypothetical protein